MRLIFHSDKAAVKKSVSGKRAAYSLLLLAMFLSSAGIMPAYAYSGISTGIKEKTLTSPNPQGGNFGYSVASSGNLIAVGAYDKTQSEIECPCGYVFIFTTGGKLLRNITNLDAGEFGYSLAMSGSLLIVGAPETAVRGIGSAGAAYAYNATTGALIANFTSPNVRTNGEYGNAVAVSGDTVVVGAWTEPNGPVFNAGNAYIYNITQPRVSIPLTNPDPKDVAAFGFSVSVNGNRVIVGAPLADYKGKIAAGAAFLYSTEGVLLEKLQSPNPMTAGYFGWSVSLSNEVVAVGAIYETVGSVHEAGQAYLFNYNGSLITALSSPNPTKFGEFGLAISAVGSTVVVGAPGNNYGGVSASGAAYEFNSSSGTLVNSFHSLNAQDEGSFGGSVSINAGLIVVGAPDEEVNGTTGAGHAYIV